MKNYPDFKFDGIGALVLFSGLLVIPVIFLVIAKSIMFLFHIDLMNSEWFNMFINTVCLVGAVALFDFIIVRPSTRKPLNFNFSSANFYTYLLVFPMVIGMMLIGEFITSLIPVTGPVFGDLYEVYSKMFDSIFQDKYIMVVMVVIIAPILEEIIFRGIIMKGMLNGGSKLWVAVLVSSLLFGLVHGNPWQFAGAVLLGAVFGLVYYKTKTLLLPVLLHAFNNLTAVLMVEYGNTESFADIFGVSQWLILGVGVVLFGVFYYLFIHQYKVHYSEN